MALLKILVVPSLPQSAQAQSETITLLRSKGVAAVIPFRTILADLINETDVIEINSFTFEVIAIFLPRNFCGRDVESDEASANA
jgi:hypothetical protein